MLTAILMGRFFANISAQRNYLSIKCGIETTSFDKNLPPFPNVAPVDSSFDALYINLAPHLTLKMLSALGILTIRILTGRTRQRGNNGANGFSFVYYYYYYFQHSQQGNLILNHQKTIEICY